VCSNWYITFYHQRRLKEVTSAIEVPHVLYWQVHQHLSSPRHSKNIISPIVSPKNVADIVLEYLSGTLNSKGVAIIHENPDLSADLAEEFVNYGPKYGMQNYAFKRWSHDTTEDLDNIILDIKQYGLKTIFQKTKGYYSGSNDSDLCYSCDCIGNTDSLEYCRSLGLGANQDSRLSPRDIWRLYM